MPRPLRIDYPGAFHHITNRGVGKRTIFETQREIRFFLSRVARAVRSGLVEVHSFVILLNHFHLLLRSRRGEVSDAMRFIQDAHAQRFNLCRQRHGPLMQGRFRSELIESAVHWENVVRYIDHNPVLAGVVANPLEYEFGSARLLAARDCPPWLTDDLIGAAVRSVGDPGGSPSEAYMEIFGGGVSPSAKMMIERRLRSTRSGADPLDDLVGKSPLFVREWARDNARLADGTSAGFFLVSGDVFLALLVEIELDEATTRTLTIGLLRNYSGQTLEEIGQRLGVSAPTVSRHARKHKHRLLSEDEYAGNVGRLLHTGIEGEYRAPRICVPFTTEQR